DAVDEAPAAGADGPQPVVRRGEGGQQHGLHPGTVGGVGPGPGFDPVAGRRPHQLVERQVGDDGAVDAAGGQGGGEALVAVVLDGVVVRHHHGGDADVDLGQVGDDPGRGGADLDGPAGGLLDDP